MAQRPLLAVHSLLVEPCCHKWEEGEIYAKQLSLFKVWGRSWPILLTYIVYVYMAASQNVKLRSIPWTHRPIHTPDPYQNAGDPDRSIRLDRADPYPIFDAKPYIYIYIYIPDPSLWPFDLSSWVRGHLDTYISKGNLGISKGNLGIYQRVT